MLIKILNDLVHIGVLAIDLVVLTAMDYVLSFCSPHSKLVKKVKNTSRLTEKDAFLSPQSSLITQETLQSPDVNIKVEKPSPTPTTTKEMNLPTSDTERDLREIEVRSKLSDTLNQLLTNADILRFLRARSFNVEKATDMIQKWGEWWETPLPGTDGMLPYTSNDGPDPHEDVYRRLMPHANLGESKDGCPIYWEKTGQSKQNNVKPSFLVCTTCSIVYF